jgi:glycosyltransferase involved in cell wall biosynthesis
MALEAMGHSLVSAIMPVFDAEDFLEAALDSLLAQDYEPYEVVVCDDASTDRSREILRSYPKIRTVHHQENRGPAAARNSAIEAARGEFIADFDADDLWPPNRLRVQADYLRDHPDIGCVLARQEWMNPPPWLGRDQIYGDIDGIPLNSAMFRRSRLEEVGGFDPAFRQSEDMDLLIRLREHGIGIEVLPEILVYRRSHGDHATAGPPPTLPLLRSLRQKWERERAAEESK